MASSSKNHFFATIIISNRGKSGYHGLTFFFQSNIFFFFFLGRVERCIRVRSIRCNFKIFDGRKKKLSAEDDEDKCLDRNFLKIKLRRKMKVS